jgi:hypothetical protein
MVVIIIPPSITLDLYRTPEAVFGDRFRLRMRALKEAKRD